MQSEYAKQTTLLLAPPLRRDKAAPSYIDVAKITSQRCRTRSSRHRRPCRAAPRRSSLSHFPRQSSVRGRRYRFPRNRILALLCLWRGGSPRCRFVPALKMQPSQPATLALRAARASSRTKTAVVQRRNLQDITITRTGKPIIRSPGGRSSLGGHTVTVFGAYGFLGRYIVNRLARRGNQVVIPYRDDMAKRFLKVSGDLGRVSFLEFDLRNTQSIEESVRHSDIVFNLIGKNYPTKNYSLFDANVESVERIAEACAKYDVDRFIHLSSYNANPDSPSEFFRTKVRECLTEAEKAGCVRLTNCIGSRRESC